MRTATNDFSSPHSPGDRAVERAEAKQVLSHGFVENVEKEQALARAKREHQQPNRSAVSSLTYVKFSKLGCRRDDKREFAGPAGELPASRLTDPARLAAYKDALSNWNFDGYIQFELTEQAYRWIRRELGNITLKEIGRCMFEYVESGGEIDEVRERRSEWSDQYEFHHDLRFLIHERPVYLETRLHQRLPFSPDESWILAVNIHAP